MAIAGRHQAPRYTPWRGQRSANFHESDKRYEVVYHDGKHRRHVWGFTDDLAEAQRWVADIRRSNTFYGAAINDRKPEVS